MKKNWKEILKLWLGALLLLAESAAIGCKKLPKKAVALCVAAALIVAMVPVAVFAATGNYGIYIGGVQITESNKDDLVQAINSAANATVARGSATYDPGSNTIILENFSYTGVGYDYGWNNRAAIYGGSNSLAIHAIGENTITCKGDGSCYGIRSESDISIYGNDAEQDQLLINSEYACILTGEALYVEDVALSLISDNSRGIDMWGTNLYAQVDSSTVSIESSDDCIFMNEHDDNGTFVIRDSLFTATSANRSAIICTNISMGSAACVVAGASEDEATYQDPVSNETYANSYVQIISDNPKNLSITREGVTEYYSCLENATRDAEPGDVIKVEHDYVEMSPEIYLASWNSYAIDLNGQDIHFQEYYWKDFGAMYYEMSGPMSLSRSSEESEDYGILTLTDSVGGGAIHALIYADGGIRIDSGTYGGLIAPYDTVIKGGTFTGLPQAAINAMMQDPYMSMFANMIGTKSILHTSFFDLLDNEEDARAYMDSIFASGYIANKEYEVYVTQSGYYLVGLPANTSIVEAYKVTLNYSAGDEESFYALPDSFTAPAYRTTNGKIFLGWYDDAAFTTLHDFNTALTNDITLYAKFADYEDDKAELQDAIDALEADVAQLNSLMNSGDIAQINAKISAIESQIAALDALKNKYAEADSALKQELEAADAAINSAIAALTTRVQDLEADLAAAKSDISTNTSKVAELTTNLATLNASLTDLSNKLTNDYVTKAELTSAINSAKDTINSAIDALTVRVQDLEAGLAAVNSKVDTNTSDVTALKSDVATLNTWKNEAQSAITALQTLTGTQGTDIANLKLAVQSLEAELAAANARIDDAEDRIAALEGKVSALEIAKQNLDAAVAALNAAINNKADTATLNQKVTDLIAAIAAAEDAAKTYADGKDTALQTQLTAAIATAKGEAITAAENLVNTAKAELQTAINNKADIATLNAKVSELNAAIATAEATAKAYTDSAVTTLNAAIITAKDEAVDAAKDLIDAAKAQLQAAIDNKADTAAVNAAIANLQNAITALQNAKDNYIAADAALKAELEEKIAKAKQEAIDAAKGHIPYIGTNGNWWIGDTDTGVDANGIKGDTGNGIASITTKKENGVTTVTITLTDPEKEPVVFTISDGETGATGADGVGVAKVEKTATNGNVDTYTITLTNGKTYTFTVTNGKDGANGKDGENGKNGADGKDGKDGADGKDGLTPFIGENGNWWIGDTDTGVKAVAEQTAQKGTDTITVVSIVVASVALLSNLALVVWIVTKKKKVLV